MNNMSTDPYDIRTFSVDCNTNRCIYTCNVHNKGIGGHESKKLSSWRLGCLWVFFLITMIIFVELA
jgi:hypothetical protein